jgi:hypothetical protein
MTALVSWTFLHARWPAGDCAADMWGLQVCDVYFDQQSETVPLPQPRPVVAQPIDCTDGLPDHVQPRPGRHCRRYYHRSLRRQRMPSARCGRDNAIDEDGRPRQSRSASFASSFTQSGRYPYVIDVSGDEQVIWAQVAIGLPKQVRRILPKARICGHVPTTGAEATNNRQAVHFRRPQICSRSFLRSNFSSQTRHRVR